MDDIRQFRHEISLVSYLLLENTKAKRIEDYPDSSGEETLGRMVYYPDIDITEDAD